MSGNNLFEQAQSLQLQGKLVEAEAIYDDLLTQNHDNAGLLATLGTLYLQLNKLGLAISLLERSAKHMPSSDVLCNLGIAYKQSGQYQKCKETFKRAMAHNPSADTAANYAALFVNVGTPHDAISHAKRALKIDAECPMAHWNMGIAELEIGKWDTAWDHHEYGFKTRPPMRIDRGANLNVPIWDGKSPGKVWIYGEQGIGDEIMFSSMIPDVLKTNDVILECNQRLEKLFSQSFDCECIGGREQNDVSWVADKKPDWRISIGSLGKFYRRTKESFTGEPYLKTDAVEKSGKFRVGISWVGGLKPGRVATRSVPIQRWESIFRNNCEFVSLQYTDCEDDLQSIEKMGFKIEAPHAAKAYEYNEVAKLVQSCDLVITICTSVVHLAGALGVPCWVMTPNKPAWRYGVEGKMPWYRSVRLYRQPKEDDSWMPVISRIGLDLENLLDSQKRIYVPNMIQGEYRVAT